MQEEEDTNDEDGVFLFFFFSLVSFTKQKEMAKLSDKSFRSWVCHDMALHRKSQVDNRSRESETDLVRGNVCEQKKTIYYQLMMPTAVSRSSFCVQGLPSNPTKNRHNKPLRSEHMQHLAEKKTQTKAETRNPKICAKTTL
jgi:hypothetical protein